MEEIKNQLGQKLYTELSKNQNFIVTLNSLNHNLLMELYRKFKAPLREGIDSELGDEINEVLK